MQRVEVPVTGVILAGGLGSRLGYQDKPLLELGGRRIIEHIIETAAPQVTRLVLNVNRHTDKYEEFGLPLIGDCTPGNAGPLAGILSAMRWCRDHDQDGGFLACFPGDVPWFPADLVTQLLMVVKNEGSESAWLRTDGQWQPLFSIWSLTIQDRLAAALEKGLYSPMQMLRSTRHAVLEINGGPQNHFLNINRPEDLETARSLIVTTSQF